MLAAAPPAPFVPEALGGRPMVGVVVLWTGPADEAEGRVAPLRLLRPAFDSVGPMPYTAFQAMLEPPAAVTARTHLEAGFLTALPSGDLDLPAPPPRCGVILQPLGGALARVAEDATPLGRRGAPWHWQAPAAWLDAAGDGAAPHWSRTVRRALAPWWGGETYPNFLARREPSRLRPAYGPARYERLRALRADWDPDGVLAGPDVVT